MNTIKESTQCSLCVQMLASYPNRAKSISSMSVLPPFYLAVNYIFPEMLQKMTSLKYINFQKFKNPSPICGRLFICK